PIHDPTAFPLGELSIASVIAGPRHEDVLVALVTPDGHDGAHDPLNPRVVDVLGTEVDVGDDSAVDDHQITLESPMPWITDVDGVEGLPHEQLLIRETERPLEVVELFRGRERCCEHNVDEPAFGLSCA